MPKVLIVEDEETIAMGVQFALQKEGYEVKWVTTLEEAKRAIQENIDLILLDVNLPDGIGYTFCEEVRSKSSVPIIILTVREAEEDMIKGLDLGADDYMTKPFKIRVLISRIQAVLRRSSQREFEKESLVGCQNVVVDKEQTKAYKEGKEVELSKSEYKLLLLLLENKNRTVTREHIMDYLWGIDGEFVNGNTLTVTMKRLRNKIEREGESVIQTIRGIGYRMED